MFRFVLSLKQKMKIKEIIYIPRVPIQELFNRPGAVFPSDGDDYLVSIPNSPKEYQYRRAINQHIQEKAGKSRRELFITNTYNANKLQLDNHDG